MPATPAPSAETECREFAAHFDTANVRDGIRHAEQGDFTWEELRDLFKRVLADTVPTDHVPTAQRFCPDCGEPEGSDWVTARCTFI